MPRVRKGLEEAEKLIKQAKVKNSLGALYTPPGTRKSKGFSITIGKKAADRYMLELDEFLEDSAYGKFSKFHWVAFFCWIHEAIYDVSCVSETMSSWGSAANQAKKLMAVEFENDPMEFAKYVQWVAKEQERLEMWHRSKRHKNTRRLGWRDLFLTRKRLTDYRVAMARMY